MEERASFSRAGARQLLRSAGNDTVAARAAAASALESDSGHSRSYPACGGGSQGGLFLPEEVAGGVPGQLPPSFVFNELSRAEILAITKAVVRASAYGAAVWRCLRTRYPLRSLSCVRRWFAAGQLRCEQVAKSTLELHCDCRARRSACGTVMATHSRTTTSWRRSACQPPCRTRSTTNIFKPIERLFAFRPKTPIERDQCHSLMTTFKHDNPDRP